FDLSKDDMLRAVLITLTGEEKVLVLTMHHIASDGWSLSVFTKELVALYSSYTTGDIMPPEPLAIQYADYALWQRRYLQGELLEKKINYWKEKLQGLTPLQLPTDYVRPVMQSTRGALSRFTIDKALVVQLQALSHEHGATLFMTALAAFKVLLYRYTGQEDICVGGVTAGRQQHEIENLIGCFINTLALRSEIKGEVTFIELLQQVKATTLEAYEHQEAPIEKVVEAVAKQRDQSRHPLYQVMFIWHNTPEVPEVNLGQVNSIAQGFTYNIAKFDTTFIITSTDQGLEGEIEYSPDLYQKETIERMIGHFKQLLCSISKVPFEKIGALPIITKDEEHQLLVKFNNTQAAYPKDSTIVDLFEEQVKRTPDKTAIIFEKEQLTYKELNQRANQVAHYLKSKGVRQETMVPICLERSLEMMIGILAIIKAGGAYVPIDPEYPHERINYILEDTKATLLVANKESKAKLKGRPDVEVIELNVDDSTISIQPLYNLRISIVPKNLAYVIYTSGSTGTPKGVMNEHGGVVNRLTWAQDYHKLTRQDTILQKTTYSFDVSVWELFWPLLAGAKLVFAKPRGHKDNDYLRYIINQHEITLLHFVPSMLNLFLEDLQKGDCTNLKTVLCSGEELKASDVNLFKEKLPNAELHNLYGPTEAAIDVTYWSLPAQSKLINRIPIGKPVYNT
ncbi:MAG: AMP-binding protein, partial [Segetibacter sp.]|nr:AMP-binding protein [Segetibacter sp.]